MTAKEREERKNKSQTDILGHKKGLWNNFVPKMYSHRGLVHVAAGNVIGSAITGIFWLYLASIQSAEDYGITNYEISLASLLASAALIGLNTTVTTSLAKGIRNVNVQANQVILISGGIAAVVSSFHNALLAPFVIGITFWMMSSYELLGLKLYKRYALTVIGARALQTAISIILYYFIGVNGIIIGFAVSFIIFSYQYYASVKRFSMNFDVLKGKMRFSLGVFSYNLSNAFLMYFDKLVLAPIFGYMTVGYYQLGFQFLIFFSMIPISFYQYLIPERSSGLSKKTNLALAGIILSLVLMTLMFILAPWIIDTFFPSYTGSISAIRILSIGILPMMLVSIINSKLLVDGSTRFIIIGAAIYQTLQIALSIYLGSFLGVTGLAISVVFALCAEAGFLVVSTYCRPKLSPDEKQTL
jgi:O-antigen/teichoic acid export membrane protein